MGGHHMSMSSRIHLRSRDTRRDGRDAGRNAGCDVLPRPDMFYERFRVFAFEPRKRSKYACQWVVDLWFRS
eukprot:5152628-Pyramimonas_sp.AAC.2